jgi:hypothetical protein
MKYEELNEMIFGELVRDYDQDIFSKSSKRVKLIIGKTIYIITGFRKEKYYLNIIPMIFQGSKSYYCEWKPGDNIFELIHELLKNELNKEKKLA